MTDKPLGGPAYGSIGHLPESRLGRGDHHLDVVQASLLTTKTRDHWDGVIVQEKLDGSCVAAYRQDDTILALTRAGYLAETSKYEQHHLWHDWVAARTERFLAVLQPGERLCGEWLAQAHGTRYDLTRLDPFVAFDIIDRAGQRLPYAVFQQRLNHICGTPWPSPQFRTAYTVGYGPPMLPATAMALLEPLCRAAGYVDPPEGLVYRMERHSRVEFLAKWVRPDKIDGLYLERTTGKIVWNWHPTQPRW